MYKVDLVIPDKLWNRIRPEGKLEGSGMLCGSCIMERIEKISDCDYWLLVKMPKRWWKKYNNEYRMGE